MYVPIVSYDTLVINEMSTGNEMSLLQKIYEGENSFVKAALNTVVASVRIQKTSRKKNSKRACAI